MLHCEYHPALVEQATFLAARRDHATERALRAKLDVVYSDVDAEQRDERFLQVHARWFVKLELDGPLRRLIAEQPLIGERVQWCHVREAVSRRRENVELFVRADANAETAVLRTLIIDICPESLLDDGRLTSWLRRELLKVSDMLDDAFGYTPNLPEVQRARENLIRDRYGVLWDAYVEARLRRTHGESAEPNARLRERFARAFSHGGSPTSECSLDLLLQITETTHARLLAWATQPESLPGWNATAIGTTRPAGDICPLCSFPTYDWYDFGQEVGTIVQLAITSARPAWRPKLGACRQCVETYAAIVEGSSSGSACSGQWSEGRSNVLLQR